ncbi:hypothetical protein N7462_010962 [Penicillium macrosclerotiorum]|uniref:uncharacterized protein n=1 Tax=Penicillium macrosclerotiorum TaxID=303699 RepID=UPI002547C5B8|nr:uncharacterized protein N7462_010962 [Penicillium macrosclerotiorum]KAJ5669892.1 hypothetical protein N7462_010962 [Penicillium macrosclerotiorum]
MASRRLDNLSHETAHSAATENQTVRTADFLWIDYQEGNSQDRELTRSKHAFIRTRHHRLRKDTQMQHFRASVQARPVDHPSPSSTNNLIQKQPQGNVGNDGNDEVSRASLQIYGLEAGVLDGFPSLASGTRQNPNIYFHHYRVHSAKSCFPLCSKDVTVWFWKKALDDPALMQIKLSISASHRAAILGSYGSSAASAQKHTQDALRLRVGTIKSLRSILHSTSKIYTESTIFIIAHLIVSEAIEANIAAVNAHMNGMKKIIAATGGLDLLDHGTLALIYSCEILRGMIGTTPPAVRMCAKFEDRIIKESLSYKLNELPTRRSTVGLHFFDASWSKHIQSKFKPIIQSFQSLITFYENLDIVQLEPMSVENDHLLFLGYQLLSLPYLCSLTPFEETIRLSIFVYASCRIWSFYGTSCLEVLVETLRESISTSFVVLESVASDLLFWILFIGSLASKGMKCHSWYLGLLTDLADKLFLEGWDSVVSILERYFFRFRSEDDPAKEIWNSAF